MTTVRLPAGLYPQRQRGGRWKPAGLLQHIGAYQVTTATGKRITFLDTPGHEAFTAMRARGAKAADVAVIVVAADDAVMPQTKEAISHAQAAGLPMVFAINKIDRDGANPEKIKEQLASMNILVEDWGGKFQSQEISAKKGLNIDLLLEKIGLEAELLDLKANPEREASGSVIEASLDKGRGYVATVLVQSGTLRNGDLVVSGQYFGRVKAMFNERNKRIEDAPPSSPVLLLGLQRGAPQGGEKFKVYEDESEAKEVANRRGQILREQGIRTKKHITCYDEIGRPLALGNFKELNLIIIKVMSWTVPSKPLATPCRNSLQKKSPSVWYTRPWVPLPRATYCWLPPPMPSSWASTSGPARRLQGSQRAKAWKSKPTLSFIMPLKRSRAPWKVCLSPKWSRRSWPTWKYGMSSSSTRRPSPVALCSMEKIYYRNSRIRLVRDGIVIYPVGEGASAELASLKRFKDDVKEVPSSMECGLTIKNYNDIHVGDIVEAYEEEEVKRTL